MRAPPPPAPGVAHKQRDEVRDWGNPVEEAGEDDIFSLQDLEEFQSTERDTRLATSTESLPAEASKRLVVIKPLVQSLMATSV